MKTNSKFFLATIIFCGLISNGSAITPSFQGLGGLSYKGDGTPYPVVSNALGISADGSTVVGQSYWVEGGGQRAHGEACYWTSSGIHPLGDLQGGGFSSKAYGVSATGSVIVGDGWSDNGNEAFRWENGVMTGLGDVSGGIFNSRACSVSANGSVVVGYGSSISSNQIVRWKDGTLTDLGAGRAFGLSADGSVIVGQSFDGAWSRAFMWTESTGQSTLQGLPYNSGQVNAISSNEQVVVGGSWASNDSYGTIEAFRWENGAAIGLGDLPGGTFYSWANDVSADGSIIVGYSVTNGDFFHNGTTVAFIWDSQHGMRNLQDILVSDFGLNLTGWSLREATGISDNGMIIVGKGINPDGFEQGWIATIPEPASLLLLGLGGLALRRRHCR